MIEQKILAVKIKAKGVVEYLRRPQVRQYENNATVIWAWFEEVGLAESITAKLHYELPDGETLTPEQLFTAYTTTEDLINDIPNTKGYGDVVIPSGTKIYTYPIPQGMTTIDGELKYNIVAYLSDGSISVSQQDKITINKSTPPTGTFVPDVIDSTLEALLASKTDLTDFNALRGGSLGFTLIDLDGHTIDWNASNGTFDMALDSSVLLELGQKEYIYGKSTEIIVKGAPIQYVGVSSGYRQFKNAVASEINANPSLFLGLAANAFSGIGVFGYATRYGNVNGLNTNAYTVGDTLWFDSTNGGLTITEPIAPKAKIRVGKVLVKDLSVGSIGVLMDIGRKISELHDVNVSSESDGNVFVYDSANGYWKGSTRLTDLEEQVLSIGGVENSAVDKVNDLLLDYADNVALVGASVDITSDTTAVNVSSYTDINLASQGSTYIDAQNGVNISVGDNFTVNAQEVQVNGTLHVNGDIVQNGASYETHAEQVYTTQNTIILRDGAVAGLGTGEWVGIVARIADGTNDAQILINGSGEVRIGDAGDTQAVATRQDSPTANGVAYWNDTNKRFDTHSAFTYNPSTTELSASNIVGTYLYGTLRHGTINNATVQTLSTGTLIQRNVADTNPALKVNLANAGATGNIVEFQKAGVNTFIIAGSGNFSALGYGYVLGISNRLSGAFSSIDMGANGTVISRNVNDSNPALTVNEQQGTGDILRLQFGGVNKLEVTKDGYINQNGNRFIHNYGTGNIFLGINSGNYTTTGSYNTAVGYASLVANTTGVENNAIGYASLASNTTGNNNTAIGRSSISSNKTGSNGVAIGYESQRYVNDTTTAWTNFNTSVGYQALRGSTTAANNTGNLNTAIGYQALMSNTTGQYNNAIGVSALYSNTTGNLNIAIGYQSLFYNTSGYFNVAIGDSSLRGNSTGNQNIAIGIDSLRVNNTGNNNSAIGNKAGYYLSNGTTGNETGSNNTFIGAETKAGATQGLSNSTALGYQAYFDASNQMVFGNASVSEFKFNRNASSRADFSSISVDTGGTLLASGDGDATVTVSALSNFKYIELRASIDGYRFSSSGKLPSSKFVYNSGTPNLSTGLSHVVGGWNGTIFLINTPVVVLPNNAGLTSIRVFPDTSNYDVFWEVIGWNY